MSQELTCFSEQVAATPLYLISDDKWLTFLASQTPTHQVWLNANNFCTKVSQWCLVPNSDGQVACVCVGVDAAIDLYALSDLASSLPLGTYVIANSDDFSVADVYLLSLGWGLGAYQFNRYKKASRACAQLKVAASIDQVKLHAELQASYWIRDLINTPAADMMPQHLGALAESLATHYHGQCQQIIGDDLLTHNYPMIHAVGRASIHPPRLIDLRFGAIHLPKVTLVGKGVCFDSGGLDIKPASGMLFMKKDMGGAAHVLGLAQLILQQQLPICLRVLIPAVENAVGSNAFHPGDILTSRQGLTVEIGNTDAEGRLVLADALSEACAENPDLIIDFSTLTGAARIAVGTEIAAYFSNDDALAGALQQASEQVQDPSWRLPLFQHYKRLFTSKIADLNNAGSSSYAGAITAALFLQAFMTDQTSWIHFDIMAFNPVPSRGKPVGGEAMGLRAVFELLKERYS